MSRSLVNISIIFYLAIVMDAHTLYARQVDLHKKYLFFENGPPITYLPLPVPDEERSWGMSCDSCATCYGHYLEPGKAVNHLPSIVSCPLPSTMILTFFKGRKPSQQQLEDLSRQVLLPCNEVQMWLDHLSTVRQSCKRGAA